MDIYKATTKKVYFSYFDSLLIELHSRASSPYIVSNWPRDTIAMLVFASQNLKKLMKSWYKKNWADRLKGVTHVTRLQAKQKQFLSSSGNILRFATPEKGLVRLIFPLNTKKVLMPARTTQNIIAEEVLFQGDNSIFTLYSCFQKNSNWYIPYGQKLLLTKWGHTKPDNFDNWIQVAMYKLLIYSTTTRRYKTDMSPCTFSNK